MNNEVIKQELLNLNKKHSTGQHIDLSSVVSTQMRKLTVITNNPIPDTLSIATDIEAKMKRNGASESSILDIKSLIRKLQNPNVNEPSKLLYFLKEMSPLCNDSIDRNNSIKPLVGSQRIAHNYRTSTPLSRETSVVASMNTENSVSTIKPTYSNENNFPRAAYNPIELQRNNASFVAPRLQKSSHNYQVSNELTEHTVIGEALFIILGLEGQWLSWNDTLRQLNTRNDAILHYAMIPNILKIFQCGLAYKKIRSYVEHCSNTPSTGVVCQGFCVALNDHLASYVNLVAILQSEYNNWTSELDGRNGSGKTENQLTICRLMLKLHEPMEVLFLLVEIIEKAGEFRGGQLASIIHGQLLHGTPDRVKLVWNLLLTAVEPFYHFIQQWVYDGVLEESHQEFFVAIHKQYDFNLSWTEKYALRPSMRPSFISQSEAQKILLTGKSINFLREICEEKTMIKGKKEIARTMNVTAESMINQEVDRQFENMINSVYTVTCEYLLKVMFDKYHLMDHLKALRKYMLHGQGDFILRMIEIIGPELSKPADELKAHNMVGPLDVAIRTTNAQYDSRDILDRLHIKFLRIAENEFGWDIFTLNYQISDIRPLFAVVNRSSFNCYLRAFNILFRSRRVHFILNSFFKERNSSHRAFNKILEVSGVLQLSHVMVMDMLHFVNQVQYYINFEVLECSWKKFMDAISKATDLDSVMENHEFFLKQVTSRCLLEPETRELLSNLRTIYDLIISFESILDEMFTKFHDELRFRKQYQEQILALKKQGTWGVDDRREKKEFERMSSFTRTDVMKFHNKLKAHNNQYESHLVKFLSTLVDHKDASLRCLYTNLDFNGRYRDRIRDHKRKL